MNSLVNHRIYLRRLGSIKRWVITMDATFDPSVPKAGEKTTTVLEMEHEVTDAYNEALTELDILLEMSHGFQPPRGDDLEALIKYRDATQRDIARLQQKIRLSRQYLTAKNSSFHYKTKRLCTSDGCSRLRWWYREQRDEVKTVQLRRGDEAAAEAQARMDETVRVRVKCYKLDSLWKRAMRAEQASTDSKRTGSSVACDSSCDSDTDGDSSTGMFGLGHEEDEYSENGKGSQRVAEEVS